MAGLVLFVCTGNTCRSPMAEALARAAFPRGTAWRVASAGLAACPGVPASDGAMNVLAEMGCDLRGHRSRQVYQELLREAAVIVAMTRAQAQQLGEIAPHARDRIHLMRSFDPGAQADEDVSDPFLGSLSDYRRCRDVILQALPGLIRFLNQTDSEPQ